MIWVKKGGIIMTMIIIGIVLGLILLPFYLTKFYK